MVHGQVSSAGCPARQMFAAALKKSRQLIVAAMKNASAKDG
jgi:hypothetical protein